MDIYGELLNQINKKVESNIFQRNIYHLQEPRKPMRQSVYCLFVIPNVYLSLVCCALTFEHF